MNDNLKPCPLCGADAETHYEKLCGTTIYMVKCSVDKCQCQEMGWHETETDATNVWNTRPIDDALQARIAELEKQAVVWHKYPDEKPTESGRYVIHRRHNVMPRIDVRFWTGKDWRDRDDSVYDRDIAYWAYLPEPPEGQ